MGFKMGNLFPKKEVDEPGLTLNDPRWATLEGGYKGTNYDASIALNQLEQAVNIQTVKKIYQELWDELHHQGDVGLASYYGVPHLVRIAKENQLIDENVLGLVSVIEIQRHTNNPRLPKLLLPSYNKALQDLGELALSIINQPWNLELASATLTAIALSKGQTKLASAILNLDSEDVIDEFLDMV